MRRQILLLERFCFCNSWKSGWLFFFQLSSSPVCGEVRTLTAIQALSVAQSKLYHQWTSRKSHTCLLAPQPAPLLTNTHLAHMPSENGKAIISTSWWTQCSQVMIHLPEQVFVTQVDDNYSCRYERKQGFASVVNVEEKQWGNDRASLISTLHVGFNGFRQNCHRKPVAAVHGETMDTM